MSCGLVPLVKKESEEALAMLRCYESEHLDMPCLEMRCDTDSRRRLYRAIDYYAPDIVFIPSLQDLHPDNMMTGLLAAHALREYESSLTLYSYEVWGGLFPNIMVEITDVMEDKIAAIKVRRSQARLIDGERKLRDSNCYRLSTMQEDRYCEPFLKQEREDHITMAERMGAYDLSDQR
jgi:LmbE family N-acetylglucosaminyl deacetylase